MGRPFSLRLRSIAEPFMYWLTDEDRTLCRDIDTASPIDQRARK